MPVLLHNVFIEGWEAAIMDVAFLPSHACLYTTFLENCCEASGHMSERCGWGKQVHAPCSIFSLQQISIVCQLCFWKSMGY